MCLPELRAAVRLQLSGMAMTAPLALPRCQQHALGGSSDLLRARLAVATPKQKGFAQLAQPVRPRSNDFRVSRARPAGAAGQRLHS